VLKPFLGHLVLLLGHSCIFSCIIVLLLALVRCRGCRRRRRNILEIYAFLINRGNVCKKTMASSKKQQQQQEKKRGQTDRANY